MITPDEWASLCLLIEEGWPGEFGDAAEKAWRVLLDDYDADRVLRAVKALVARGGKFRPSVAEVVAEIRHDPSRPTFEEAYRLIYGRGGVLRARLPYAGPIVDADARRGEAMRARMSEIHPLVAAFVDRFGLGRLRALAVDDPDYGELRRKELREAWDRHVEAVDGREIAQFASGRRDGLQAFDPLAVLGAPGADRRQIAAATNQQQEGSHS